MTEGLNLRPDKYPNGTNDPERNFGRESRALKATYELYQVGVGSVVQDLGIGMGYSFGGGREP